MESVPLPGSPATDQSDALGQRSASEVARRIADDHRKALSARRPRDLLAEKILLHIDGTGDNQWADIFGGERVSIPPDVARYHQTEPILGPIVQNQIAYHTTMPLRFLAEARNDAASRQRAKVDTAFANYIAQTQRVNQLASAAMLLADAAGFCPMHAYWRDDVAYDAYEPLYLSQEQMQAEGLAAPRKGIIDCWVGNPFDTTFNPGAKRGSIQAQTYARVLPGQMIRDRFGVSLEGSTKLPSASVFQRIARLWNGLADLQIHGTTALTGGQNASEDLIAVLCREIAPGVDPEWPEGRLTIVALPGTAETRGSGANRGRTPVLLADQPLPAARFSSVLVYSGHAFDDVHGSPWAEPLSKLQVQLNLALSQQWELLRKAAEAPTLVSGEIAEDDREFGGFNLVPVTPLGMGTFSASPLPVSEGAIAALEKAAERIRTAMYTIGGYQAASRGESKSGDPFAKTALLAQQDDTIHGPTNVAFRGAMEDYAGLWWCLFKQYGDVPWLLDAVGDEFDEIPEEYIDRTHLSETAPSYRVVSGYGATPEIKGRQLMQLVQIQGADGEPFLRTVEARKQWPDGSLFGTDLDPAQAQKKRAKRVAAEIRRAARLARPQVQQQAQAAAQQMAALPPEWQAQAAQQFSPQAVEQQVVQQVFVEMEQKFPRLRDDDLAANLAALSEISQDETEDAIARGVARLRQEQFWAWQAQIAASQMMAMGAPQGAPQAGAPQGGPTQIQPEMEADPMQQLAEQRSALQASPQSPSPLSAA